MNKDFGKNKQKQAQSVEKFYAKYEAEAKKHMQQIVKVQHKEITYYTSYAKKSKVYQDICTIVLFQKGGLFMLGYCRETKGFPFIQHVEPYITAVLALNQVKKLQLNEKYIKIEATEKFKYKDTNYDWSFAFETNQLKQKWFFLVVYLWYCTKKLLKPNIDIVIKQKTILDLRKQERNQKKSKIQGNKPAKLEEPFQSSTHSNFVQLQSQIAQLKNKQKQSEQIICQILNILSNRPSIKKQNTSNQLSLQIKPDFANILNQHLSPQQVAYLNKLKQEQNSEIQTLKRQIAVLNKDKQNQTQSKLAVLNEMSKYDRHLKEVEKNEKNYLQQIERLKKIVQTKYIQNEQHRNPQQNTKANQQTNHNQVKNQQVNKEMFRKALEAKEQQLKEKIQHFEPIKRQLHQLFQSKKKQLLSEKESLELQLKQEKTKNKNMGEQNTKLLHEKNGLLQQIQTLKIDLNKQKQKHEQHLRSSNQNQQLRNKQIQQLKNKLEQIVEKQKETAQSLQKERNITHKCQKDAQEKEAQFYQLQERYTLTVGQFESFKQSSQTQKHRMYSQINQIRGSNQIYRKQSESQKKQLSQKLDQVATQNQELKAEKQRLINQIQQLIGQTKKMKQLEVTAQTALQNLNRSKLLHIFQGSILENKQYYKQFMKEEIEAYTNKKILKTKKLYTLEKEVNSNFHRYTDEIPQIAVIVQTEAGFYLAGYSQSPISTKIVANKGGLIMSLNNRKSFPVIPGKRTVSYDTFFLIIGNSEIRLKNQEWKVFSNFGIASSFFNSYGCGVNELLGEGQGVRQVMIITFEIHQIIYE